MKNCLFLLFISIFSGIAWGQVATPTPIPPPSAPLVLESPPNSTYTITITYTEDQKNKEGSPQNSIAGNQAAMSVGDRPVSIQVWRDKSSRRILVKHANGAETEGYLHESGFLVRSAKNSESAFGTQESGKSRSATTSLFTNFYQGTQWLDMKFYKGTESSKSGDYYIFEQPPSKKPMPEITDPLGLPPPDWDPLEYSALRAKLHAPSKIPVEVIIAEATYRYSPIEKWNGTIVLPEKFTKAGNEFSRELSIIQKLERLNKRQ